MVYLHTPWWGILGKMSFSSSRPPKRGQKCLKTIKKHDFCRFFGLIWCRSLHHCAESTHNWSNLSELWVSSKFYFKFLSWVRVLSLKKISEYHRVWVKNELKLKFTWVLNQISLLKNLLLKNKLSDISATKPGFWTEIIKILTTWVNS